MSVMMKISTMMAVLVSTVRMGLRSRLLATKVKYLRK